MIFVVCENVSHLDSELKESKQQYMQRVEADSRGPNDDECGKRLDVRFFSFQSGKGKPMTLEYYPNFLRKLDVEIRETVPACKKISFSTTSIYLPTKSSYEKFAYEMQKNHP